MLERLTIRDLAVVERAEVVLGPGLNAITGETGAGKSLVVQSVSLLVGERSDADAVRDGAAAASVVGEFRLAGPAAQRVGVLLSEWGVEFDGDTLIVRREVAASTGRSRATVNQTAVTLAALKRLGELLADLHGQHDHQSLLRPDAGLTTLDRLGGLEAERGSCAESVAAWRESLADLDRLQASLATFAERADYLRHAARELDDARLVAGEEDELTRLAARLAHADRLRESVASALERLSEGEAAALTSIAQAKHAIDQAASLDPALAGVVATLSEAEIATGEAARALAEYADGLEADPRALEQTEARRDLIARLTRKYRREVPELLAWRAEIGRELSEGEDSSGSLDRARAAAKRREDEALAAARDLSRRRGEAAKEWGPRITRELKPLGLPHARIAFELESSADASGLTPAGLDSARIGFTANAGESARPLAKIASGGELSRVMLALKTALETQDRVDLLLFDEVDSGIGGAVAQAVGERLRRLARHRQILCVTHEPLIAAQAEHHLRVIKHVSGGRTLARIDRIEGDERIGELARMLAGERVTETTRRQARELLSETPGMGSR